MYILIYMRTYIHPCARSRSQEQGLGCDNMPLMGGDLAAAGDARRRRALRVLFSVRDESFQIGLRVEREEPSPRVARSS